MRFATVGVIKLAYTKAHGHVHKFNTFYRIMNFTFQPRILTVASSAQRFSTDAIKDEPMLFGADLAFAREHGGELTRHVLDTLGKSAEFVGWRENFEKGKLARTSIVIDSRVNMLMPGMYPSIPGWHGDDVPRGVKYAQPDLNGVDTDEFIHFMVLFSDNATPVSATEFVVEPVTLDVDPENVWKSVNAGLEALKPKTSKLREGDIIAFGQEALHRASPCVQAGWRFFMRVSFTYRKPVNEIRQQVQVYMPIEASGW